MITKIYYPYTEWEDYQNGMYNTEVKKKEILIKCGIRLLSRPNDFDKVLHHLTENWVISTEENLSNIYCNRRAWLGQAACCYRYGVPEILTRQSWKQLTDMQRHKANNIADKHIRIYERKNKRLYSHLGKKMLPGDTARDTRTAQSTKQSTFVQGHLFGDP